MQGYNLHIQHFFGKVNTTYHLSRQSLDQEIRYKNLIRAENNKSVEHMRIPEDTSDGQIQQIISDIVSKNQFVQAQIQDEAQVQFSPVFKISPRRRQCMTSIY